MSEQPIAPHTTLGRLLSSPRDESAEDHLKFGLCEMALALPAYEQAERYYDGKTEELFSHPRIEKAFRNTKNRFKVNFAKTPVNVVADRLAISSVTVKLRTEEDSTDSTEQPNAENGPPKGDYTKVFQTEVWKHCKMLKVTTQVHRKASMFGDAYLFIWPDSDANDETTNQPVAYYNSPKTTRVIYDPEAPDRPLFVIKRWKAATGRTKANLYYKDRVVHYILKESVKPGDDKENDPASWEGDGETPTPFNRLTIFHYHNDDPYGKPEHLDGYGPQDAVNKISTTMVHATEMMGFPQRYGLTEANESLGGANPSNNWNDEEDATEPSTNPDSEMASGPGTLLLLEGLKAAGTFAAAEAKGFLEPMEFYVRALGQTTTTPLRFFYPPGAHPPSGESYRAEDTPLINKVRRRQDSYEDPHRDAFAFCMEIVTGIDADSFEVDVKWAPPATIEDALGWETVTKKIDAGVPRRQALIEAGYSAEMVDEWLRNNVDKAEFKRDIETLSLLAAAGKNMADTAASHGLNPEAVGLVLTHLMQKFAPPNKTLPALEKQPPTPAPNPDPRAGIEPPPRLDLSPGEVRPTRIDA